MTEPMDRAEESALWRHWRTAVNAAGEAAPAPDPLLLAAYAEHRLSETAAEAVEAWLALHPEAITDVLAAGEANTRRAAIEPPTGAALARAMALVSSAHPKIVRLRRPAPRAATWRVTVRQGAVAASLLVVSLVGFVLGTDAYTSLLSGDQQVVVSQDLFDPPSGIFSGFGEDSSS
jgi:anti-sigma factor RsiW